jgi:hypothetical protein
MPTPFAPCRFDRIAECPNAHGIDVRPAELRVDRQPQIIRIGICQGVERIDPDHLQEIRGPRPAQRHIHDSLSISL